MPRDQRYRGASVSRQSAWFKTHRKRYLGRCVYHPDQIAVFLNSRIVVSLSVPDWPLVKPSWTEEPDFVM